MRSHLIIVAKVFSQNPPQVSFTKHDHMIQTLTPNAADQSFGIGILPRRARRRDNFFNAHSGYTTAKILSVYLIAISEQESWCCVFREPFDELLCRPDSGGVCAYIEM